MCMCGGIVEIGLITALVGYIGKKLHKCNCECHKQKRCEHCKTIYTNETKNNKIKKRYKFIQYVLCGIMILGLIASVFGMCGILKENHHHTINCEHHVHK